MVVVVMRRAPQYLSSSRTDKISDEAIKKNVDVAVRYNLPFLIALVLVTRRDSLGTEFEMLGSLDAQLLLGFTFFAFQSKDNLARRLGLLVKDGLGLSAKSHLLAVVPTLALRKVARLAGLVLRHLVVGVLLALTCTVGLAFLGDIDHVC